MKNIIKNIIIAVGIISIIALINPVKVSASSTCSASGCNRTATRGRYCSTHGCAECGRYKNNGSVYCNYHASSKLSNRKDLCAKEGCYRSKASGSSYCSDHTAKTTTKSTSSSKSYKSSSKKKSYSSSSKSKRYEMPDCDDYEDYDDFMDDWDGCMPDGSDAEDYWENW